MIGAGALVAPLNVTITEGADGTIDVAPVPATGLAADEVGTAAVLRGGNEETGIAAALNEVIVILQAPFPVDLPV
jgi:hypothetical protein